MDEGFVASGPGVLREEARNREKVVIDDWNTPVEVRIWLPDGIKLRVRSFLRELTVERAYSRLETDFGWDQVYLRSPGERFYTVRAEGGGWRMDRRGKPVIG